ncbi:MAG: GvpL/GvpF family gas vesicle protein [Gemmatimonadetes bacterium]|nr:GvpL/GvpF family gas vesicle protein [Gemmatimonadota bacterium]
MTRPGWRRRGRRVGAEAQKEAAPPAEAPAAAGAESAARGAPTGYYFYGVVRARGGPPRAAANGAPLTVVPYRDLEALVRPAPFHLPSLDAEHLQAHQRTVESVMHRATILPAPYGVVFRGRRGLIRFLQEQYLVLDETLAFLEGHWEMRLHIAPQAAGLEESEVADLAMGVYAELRRFARAAVPFRGAGRQRLSAAFLVERSAWIDFVERTDDLGRAHPELTLEVTGPWPPYDFVRMVL